MITVHKILFIASSALILFSGLIFFKQHNVTTNNHFYTKDHNLNQKEPKPFSNLTYYLQQRSDDNSEVISPVILEQLGKSVDWRLFPNYEVVLKGYDDLIGLPAPESAFVASFTNPNRTIQNAGEGMLIFIPDQLDVVPESQCSFQISINSYTSARSYAESKTEDSKSSDGFNVDLGFLGFGSSDSEEETVKTAKSLLEERSGQIFEAFASCQVYRSRFRIPMKSLPDPSIFTKRFLNTINEVEEYWQCRDIVRRFGIKYLAEGVLGGTLTQLSVIDTYYLSTTDSSTIRRETAESFEATLKFGSFGFGGNDSDSDTSQTSTNSSNTYKTSSSHSSMITNGGAPGSADSQINGTTGYPKWASTVPMNPYPIRGSIYGLIPELFPPDATNQHGLVIRTCLLEGSKDYVKQPVGPTIPPSKRKEKMTTLRLLNGHYPGLPDGIQYPSLIVKLGDGKMVLLQQQERNYVVSRFLPLTMFSQTFDAGVNSYTNSTPTMVLFDMVRAGLTGNINSKVDTTSVTVTPSLESYDIDLIASTNRDTGYTSLFFTKNCTITPINDSIAQNQSVGYVPYLSMILTNMSECECNAQTPLCDMYLYDNDKCARFTSTENVLDYESWNNGLVGPFLPEQLVSGGYKTCHNSYAPKNADPIDLSEVSQPLILIAGLEHDPLDTTDFLRTVSLTITGTNGTYTKNMEHSYLSFRHYLYFFKQGINIGIPLSIELQTYGGPPQIVLKDLAVLVFDNTTYSNGEPRLATYELNCDWYHPVGTHALFPTKQIFRAPGPLPRC